MPTIYLTHSKHGAKVANMEAEANADIANGWVVYIPEKQIKTVKAVKVVEVVEVVEVADVADVADVAEEVFEQPAPVKRRRRN
jgi:hypothetical protein